MAEKTQAQKAKEALEAANKKKADEAAAAAAANQQSEDAKAKAASDAAAAAAAAAEEAKTEDKEDSKPQPDKDGFLNPFIAGVTYDDFNKARGKKSVESYCKGKLDKAQIAWIESEIKAHKKNKK